VYSSTNNRSPHKNDDLSPKYSKTYQGSKDSLVILHQNIRGLQNKRDELLILLYQNPKCLSEHHLKNEKIETLTLNQYILGAKLRRQSCKGGGVCIYIQDSITFCNINLNEHLNEKDFEICAVKINNLAHTIIIMTIDPQIVISHPF
jgi:hypothetical protein